MVMRTPYYVQFLKTYARFTTLNGVHVLHAHYRGPLWPPLTKLEPPGGVRHSMTSICDFRQPDFLPQSDYKAKIRIKSHPYSTELITYTYRSPTFTRSELCSPKMRKMVPWNLET